MPKTYIILKQDDILLQETASQLVLPESSDIENFHLEHTFFLHELNGTEYHVAKLATENFSGKLINLRDAYLHLGKNLSRLVARGRQLLDWRIDHQYCGRCGALMEYFDHDRAKKCSACGLINYPRISPCILVAITRGNEILLARSIHFRPGLYSVLAGFVEPAETLEECVHREVMEEVGIKIKNLRYIDSQAWPFPNQLMCGFIADYDSGEIKIDSTELSDAQWFSREKLPSTLPLPFSLSFELIQTWLNH
ncbi:MAG: diphosphatase [Gammaproteobacteria bacterium]|jgi:NAD+ diphosphatase|nr:diphosphatase [Gammaproteobacteria bacterium]